MMVKVGLLAVGSALTNTLPTISQMTIWEMVLRGIVCVSSIEIVWLAGLMTGIDNLPFWRE